MKPEFRRNASGNVGSSSETRSVESNSIIKTHGNSIYNAADESRQTNLDQHSASRAGCVASESLQRRAHTSKLQSFTQQSNQNARRRRHADGEEVQEHSDKQKEKIKRLTFDIKKLDKQIRKLNRQVDTTKTNNPDSTSSEDGSYAREKHRCRDQTCRRTQHEAHRKINFKNKRATCGCSEIPKSTTCKKKHACSRHKCFQDTKKIYSKWIKRHYLEKLGFIPTKEKISIEISRIMTKYADMAKKKKLATTNRTDPSSSGWVYQTSRIGADGKTIEPPRSQARKRRSKKMREDKQDNIGEKQINSGDSSSKVTDGYSSSSVHPSTSTEASRKESSNSITDLVFATMDVLNKVVPSDGQNRNIYLSSKQKRSIEKLQKFRCIAAIYTAPPTLVTPIKVSSEKRMKASATKANVSDRKRPTVDRAVSAQRFSHMELRDSAHVRNGPQSGEFKTSLKDCSESSVYSAIRNQVPNVVAEIIGKVSSSERDMQVLESLIANELEESVKTVVANAIAATAKSTVEGQISDSCSLTVTGTDVSNKDIHATNPNLPTDNKPRDQLTGVLSSVSRCRTRETPGTSVSHDIVKSCVPDCLSRRQLLQKEMYTPQVVPTGQTETMQTSESLVYTSDQKASTCRKRSFLQIPEMSVAMETRCAESVDNSYSTENRRYNRKLGCVSLPQALVHVGIDHSREQSISNQRENMNQGTYHVPGRMISAGTTDMNQFHNVMEQPYSKPHSASTKCTADRPRCFASTIAHDSRGSNSDPHHKIFNEGKDPEYCLSEKHTVAPEVQDQALSFQQQQFAGATKHESHTNPSLVSMTGPSYMLPQENNVTKSLEAKAASERQKQFSSINKQQGISGDAHHCKDLEERSSTHLTQGRNIHQLSTEAISDQNSQFVGTTQRESTVTERYPNNLEQVYSQSYVASRGHLRGPSLTTQVVHSQEGQFAGIIHQNSGHLCHCGHLEDRKSSSHVIVGQERIPGHAQPNQQIKQVGITYRGGIQSQESENDTFKEVCGPTYISPKECYVPTERPITASLTYERQFAGVQSQLMDAHETQDYHQPEDRLQRPVEICQKHFNEGKDCMILNNNSTHSEAQEQALANQTVLSGHITKHSSNDNPVSVQTISPHQKLPNYQIKKRDVSAEDHRDHSGISEERISTQILHRQNSPRLSSQVASDKQIKQDYSQTNFALKANYTSANMSTLPAHLSQNQFTSASHQKSDHLQNCSHLEDRKCSTQVLQNQKRFLPNTHAQQDKPVQQVDVTHLGGVCCPTQASPKVYYIPIEKPTEPTLGNEEQFAGVMQLCIHPDLMQYCCQSDEGVRRPTGGVVPGQFASVVHLGHFHHFEDAKNSLNVPPSQEVLQTSEQAQQEKQVSTTHTKGIPSQESVKDATVEKSSSVYLSSKHYVPSETSTKASTKQQSQFALEVQHHMDSDNLQHSGKSEIGMDTSAENHSENQVLSHQQGQLASVTKQEWHKSDESMGSSTDLLQEAGSVQAESQAVTLKFDRSGSKDRSLTCVAPRKHSQEFLVQVASDNQSQLSVMEKQSSDHIHTQKRSSAEEANCIGKHWEPTTPTSSDTNKTVSSADCCSEKGTVANTTSETVKQTASVARGESSSSACGNLESEENSSLHITNEKGSSVKATQDADGRQSQITGDKDRVESSEHILDVHAGKISSDDLGKPNVRSSRLGKEATNGSKENQQVGSKNSEDRDMDTKHQHQEEPKSSSYILEMHNSTAKAFSTSSAAVKQTPSSDTFTGNSSGEISGLNQCSEKILPNQTSKIPDHDATQSHEAVARGPAVYHTQENRTFNEKGDVDVFSDYPERKSVHSVSGEIQNPRLQEEAIKLSEIHVLVGDETVLDEELSVKPALSEQPTSVNCRLMSLVQDLVTVVETKTPSQSTLGSNNPSRSEIYEAKSDDRFSDSVKSMEGFEQLPEGMLCSERTSKSDICKASFFEPPAAVDVTSEDLNDSCTKQVVPSTGSSSSDSDTQVQRIKGVLNMLCQNGKVPFRTLKSTFKKASTERVDQIFAKILRLANQACDDKEAKDKQTTVGHSSDRALVTYSESETSSIGAEETTQVNLNAHELRQIISDIVRDILNNKMTKDNVNAEMKGNRSAEHLVEPSATSREEVSCGTMHNGERETAFAIGQRPAVVDESLKPDGYLMESKPASQEEVSFGAIHGSERETADATNNKPVFVDESDPDEHLVERNPSSHEIICETAEREAAASIDHGPDVGECVPISEEPNVDILKIEPKPAQAISNEEAGSLSRVQSGTTVSSDSFTEEVMAAINETFQSFMSDYTTSDSSEMSLEPGAAYCTPSLGLFSDSSTVTMSKESSEHQSGSFPSIGNSHSTLEYNLKGLPSGNSTSTHSSFSSNMELIGTFVDNVLEKTKQTLAVSTTMGLATKVSEIESIIRGIVDTMDDMKYDITTTKVELACVSAELKSFIADTQAKNDVAISVRISNESIAKTHSTNASEISLGSCHKTKSEDDSSTGYIQERETVPLRDVSDGSLRTLSSGTVNEMSRRVVSAMLADAIHTTPNRTSSCDLDSGENNGIDGKENETFNKVPNGYVKDKSRNIIGGKADQVSSGDINRKTSSQETSHNNVNKSSSSVRTMSSGTVSEVSRECVNGIVTEALKTRSTPLEVLSCHLDVGEMSGNMEPKTDSEVSVSGELAKDISRDLVCGILDEAPSCDVSVEKSINHETSIRVENESSSSTRTMSNGTVNDMSGRIVNGVVANRLSTVLVEAVTSCHSDLAETTQKDSKGEIVQDMFAGSINDTSNELLYEIPIEIANDEVEEMPSDSDISNGTFEKVSRDSVRTISSGTVNEVSRRIVDGVVANVLPTTPAEAVSCQSDLGQRVDNEEKNESDNSKKSEFLYGVPSQVSSGNLSENTSFQETLVRAVTESSSSVRTLSSGTINKMSMHVVDGVVTKALKTMPIEATSCQSVPSEFIGTRLKHGTDSKTSSDKVSKTSTELVYGIPAKVPKETISGKTSLLETVSAELLDRGIDVLHPYQLSAMNLDDETSFIQVALAAVALAYLNKNNRAENRKEPIASSQAISSSKLQLGNRSSSSISMTPTSMPSEIPLTSSSKLDSVIYETLLRAANSITELRKKNSADNIVKEAESFLGAGAKSLSSGVMSDKSLYLSDGENTLGTCTRSSGEITSSSPGDSDFLLGAHVKTFSSGRLSTRSIENGTEKEPKSGNKKSPTRLGDLSAAIDRTVAHAFCVTMSTVDNLSKEDVEVISGFIRTDLDLTAEAPKTKIPKKLQKVMCDVDNKLRCHVSDLVDQRIELTDDIKDTVEPLPADKEDQKQQLVQSVTSSVLRSIIAADTILSAYETDTDTSHSQTAIPRDFSGSGEINSSRSETTISFPDMSKVINVSKDRLSDLSHVIEDLVNEQFEDYVATWQKDHQITLLNSSNVTSNEINYFPKGIMSENELRQIQILDKKPRPKTVKAKRSGQKMNVTLKNSLSISDRNLEEYTKCSKELFTSGEENSFYTDNVRSMPEPDLPSTLPRDSISERLKKRFRKTVFRGELQSGIDSRPTGEQREKVDSETKIQDVLRKSDSSSSATEEERIQPKTETILETNQELFQMDTVASSGSNDSLVPFDTDIYFEKSPEAKIIIDFVAQNIFEQMEPDKSRKLLSEKISDKRMTEGVTTGILEELKKRNRVLQKALFLSNLVRILIAYITNQTMSDHSRRVTPDHDSVSIATQTSTNNLAHRYLQGIALIDTLSDPELSTTQRYYQGSPETSFSGPLSSHASVSGELGSCREEILNHIIDELMEKTAYDMDTEEGNEVRKVVSSILKPLLASENIVQTPAQDQRTRNGNSEYKTHGAKESFDKGGKFEKKIIEINIEAQMQTSDSVVVETEEFNLKDFPDENVEEPSVEMKTESINSISGTEPTNEISPTESKDKISTISSDEISTTESIDVISTNSTTTYTDSDDDGFLVGASFGSMEYIDVEEVYEEESPARFYANFEKGKDAIRPRERGGGMGKRAKNEQYLLVGNMLSEKNDTIKLLEKDTSIGKESILRKKGQQPRNSNSDKRVSFDPGLAELAEEAVDGKVLNKTFVLPAEKGRLNTTRRLLFGNEVENDEAQTQLASTSSEGQGSTLKEIESEQVEEKQSKESFNENNTEKGSTVELTEQQKSERKGLRHLFVSAGSVLKGAKKTSDQTKNEVLPFMKDEKEHKEDKKRTKKEKSKKKSEKEQGSRKRRKPSLNDLINEARKNSNVELHRSSTRH